MYNDTIYHKNHISPSQIDQHKDILTIQTKLKTLVIALEPFTCKNSTPSTEVSFLLKNLIEILDKIESKLARSERKCTLLNKSSNKLTSKKKTKESKATINKISTTSNTTSSNNSDINLNKSNESLYRNYNNFVNIIQSINLNVARKLLVQNKPKTCHNLTDYQTEFMNIVLTFKNNPNRPQTTTQNLKTNNIQSIQETKQVKCKFKHQIGNKI